MDLLNYSRGINRSEGQIAAQQITRVCDQVAFGDNGCPPSGSSWQMCIFIVKIQDIYSCEISSTKWVLYVQYIPTHVPHVVFHVEMFILPYGDLLWLKHWIKTVAPLLHFVFAFVSLKPLLRLW